MLNLLAIWRAHGLDEILREAWDAGVLICGQSAGAMCWFERRDHQLLRRGRGRPRASGSCQAASASTTTASPSAGLAILGAIERRPPRGLGLDDQAGVLFEGTEMRTAFSARPGAGVWS